MSGRKSQVLVYLHKIANKFLSSSVFSFTITIVVRNNSSPSHFVSFCDPYSVRACAALIDDFYKIAVQDVVKSSGPLNP